MRLTLRSTSPAWPWPVDLLVLAAMGLSLAFTVYMLDSSQGRGSWWLDVVVGTAVAVCVPLRRVNGLVANGAALAVAVTGALVAWASDLPQEPGPAASLGLAVLTASTAHAERRAPAAVLGLCGLGLVAVTHALTGPERQWVTAPTAYLVGALVGGALAGLVLRSRDRSDRRLTIR